MNAPSSDIRTGSYLVFGNGQCQVRTSREVVRTAWEQPRDLRCYYTPRCAPDEERGQAGHPDSYRDIRCVSREGFIITFSVAAQLVWLCSVGSAFVRDLPVRRGVIS